MLGLSVLEIFLLLNLTVMLAVSAMGFRYAVKEMRQIHLMLNSMLRELIDATAKAAHSAGVEEERGRPQERH